MAPRLEDRPDRESQSRLARFILRSQPLTCGQSSEMGPRFRGDDGMTDKLILHEDPVSGNRSEEHTSELQSLMRISYAVFCLKKKKKPMKNYKQLTHSYHTKLEILEHNIYSITTLYCSLTLRDYIKKRTIY